MTSRLRLVAATADLVQLEIEQRDQFFDRLGVEFAEDWPSENLASVLPLFLAELHREPTLVGWMAWYWILEHSVGRQLVGGGGFKGAPVRGIVEIGYETRPAFQRQGFATEAVSGLAQWALSQPTVDAVIAETSMHNHASIGVLRQVGFECVGAGSEADLLHFRLARGGDLT